MHRLAQSLLLQLFFLACFSISFAQVDDNYIEGDLLVQIYHSANINDVVKDLNRKVGHRTSITLGRHVSRNAHIWQLQFDPTNISHETMIQLAYENKSVQIAQNNHKLKLRATTPNDTEFANQWQYINTGAGGGVAGADIDADLAWDFTTGGTTAFGDTIVVAVIDDGLSLNHEDFEDNLWVNRAEIPGNGIDDDNNFYVDDVNGWDADNQNGNIGDGGGHGTPVAGIIGAKGNNNKGVAGVNWNVKLMIIQGGTPEMLAIASYDYALTLRKTYNATAGAKGAFVVATNSSWGEDMGQPSDSPLWCAFYDTLGVHGILSCGATANANFDIDAVGDLPTACPSDYLISVTNMNKSDVKVTSAGYGATTIDLGSFGEDAHTCNSGGGYSGFGGTSGATPHVTGAVALLYSLPCPSFIAIAKSDPGVAALMAKEYILNGTDPNTSLAGITVTGGRQNLHKSLLLALDSCNTSACLPPYSILFSNIDVNSFTVSWDALSSAQSYDFRYREVGATSWTTISVASKSHTVSGLSDCTDYEIQLGSGCAGGSSGFGSSKFVTTDGCCSVPGNISVSVSANQATVSWNDVTAAVSYGLQYKPINEAVWTEISSLTSSPYVISGLAPCTEYEVQLQTACSGQTIPYGPSSNFETECGACTTQQYCMTTANPGSEWIAEVTIGNNTNSTAAANGGFAEYTSLGFTLETGKTYPINLVPSFSGSMYDEYFLVWMDLNQDGDFEDVDELIFDPMVSSSTAVSGMVSIPSNAVTGNTRMRVAMSWDTPPVLCAASIEYGEVEDYCVLIQAPVANENLPSAISAVSIYPNPFNSNFSVHLMLEEAQTLSYELIDLTGRQLDTGSWGMLGRGQHSAFISPKVDLASGVYFLKVNSESGSFVRKLIRK